MNNQLVIEQVYEKKSILSRVRLAPVCFAKLLPSSTEYIKPVEEGWESGIKGVGTYNRKYIFSDGAELLSIFNLNGNGKSTFLVTNEVADTHYVAGIVKTYKLTHNISEFEKVAVAQ